MQFKDFLVGLAADALAGCASVGTAFDMNVVDTFVAQKTSLQEVKEKLGAPNASTAMPDGSTMYGWTYSKATPGAASTQSVMIKFSSEGKFLQVVSRYQTKTN